MSGTAANSNSNTNKAETKPFPKYESHCHGAPVRIEPHQRVKYFCTECGEPCVARQKK